jgi:hypothetical protein
MLSVALAQQAQLEGIAKLVATAEFCKASTAIAIAAREFEEITSDDAWTLLEAAGITTFLHPNAMGAAFKNAAQQGLIVATGRCWPSTRVSGHGRMVQVWKSRVFKEELA